MIQTLLIGTDESAEAAAALDWASMLAGASGAAVTVAEAYQPAQAELTPEVAEKRRFEVESRLTAWSTSRWPADLDPPTTLAVRGDPASMLGAVARDVGADIVIIGSKPFEGVTPLGLGSLAHALARHLERPLIVVPKSARPLRGGCVVADLQDAGAVDDDLLDWCDEIAGLLRATVCEVHQAGRGPGPSSGQALRAGHERLERTSTHQVEVLYEVAFERDAELIVLTIPVRHRLGHPLHTVSDRLLHHPTRPVAVLPALDTDDGLGRTHRSAAAAAAGPMTHPVVPS
jgi:nucleotide-binding universal stress UspA family protein